MAVINPHLKRIREELNDSQTVVKAGIANLNRKIRLAGRPKPGTKLDTALKANKLNLRNAQNVLKGLQQATMALRNGCCQNDQNCIIDSPDQ